MFQQGDEEHLKAMDEMKDLMKNPDAMKEWFENKRIEFDALLEDIRYEIKGSEYLKCK